jgi:hypothetical protein
MHLGSRTEGNPPTEVEKAPADVHVVSCRRVGRVETPDVLQRRPTHGEVAAGDVFGTIIADEDLDRAARRQRHCPLHEPRIRKRQIGPSGRDDGGVLESQGEVIGPFGVAFRVGIEVGDDLARRGSQPGVPCGAQAAVWQREHLERAAASQLECPVGRPVVAYQDLQSRVVDPRQGLQAAADAQFLVVGAHDGRDGRP